MHTYVRIGIRLENNPLLGNKTKQNSKVETLRENKEQS